MILNAHAPHDWNDWLHRGERHIARNVNLERARANGFDALMHKLIERAALNQYLDAHGLGRVCMRMPATPPYLKMTPAARAVCESYPAHD
jgi:hypothetical protein